MMINNEEDELYTFRPDLQRTGLYSVQIGAQRKRGDDTELYSGVFHVIQSSPAEATAVGLQEAIRQYPREDGWTGQSSAVVRIADDLILQAAKLIGTVAA